MRKEYYQQNKEEILLKKKGYYKDNKDLIKERRKTHNIDLEKKRASARRGSKRWRELHPKQAKESNRKSSKKHYQNNRENCLLKSKNYQKDNKELVNNQHRKWYDERRQKALILLGEKCSNPKCLVPNGCSDSRCLQFDHIDGGGTKLKASGLPFWRKVRKRQPPWQMDMAGWSKSYARWKPKTNIMAPQSVPLRFRAALAGAGLIDAGDPLGASGE